MGGEQSSGIVSVILLDTHVLLWLADDDARLGEQARDAVKEAAASRAIVVSAISFWEIGLLMEKQRISMSLPLADFAALVGKMRGIKVVPVNSRIAVESGNLPAGLHGDPGDRLIAATARALACSLLTSDTKLLEYGAAGHVRTLDARC